MQDLETFLSYFQKVRGRTMRVAACIPEEAFESSPIGKGFTFGEILRHLAGLERYMFAENAAGRNSSYPGHDVSMAEGREATFAYMARLHDEAMEIFRALGDEGMLAPCVTPGNAAMPAWKWLRSMVEHEAHHRGQIYTYLSVLGITTPPLYGLTAEEVMARSVERAS
ncbi:MAG TPA: DinB family protein [Thermoanaerobaculia bacterium]|nr:DinB family protein [Thermoanaerobaculia bacterium]